MITLLVGLAWTATLAKAPVGTARVMTYNVWNFDSGANWEQRKLAIARTVRFSRADVVGFQEVRRSHDGKRDQLADLKALLPELPHVKFAAGETYGEGDSAVDEGIALFSRWPVVEDATETLALGMGGDSNHRKALYMLVELPYARSAVASLDALDSATAPARRTLGVVVTHWSFDRAQQMANVEGVLAFMERVRAKSSAGAVAPQLAMGDFNFYMDYEQPAAVFAKGNAKGVLPFDDVWTAPRLRGLTRDGPKASTHPLSGPKSFTFSNIAALKNRPDRIFIQGGAVAPGAPRAAVARAELHGQKEASELAASDHLALLTELRVSSCAAGCAYCLPATGGKAVGECLVCDDALLLFGAVCVAVCPIGHAQTSLARLRATRPDSPRFVQRCEACPAGCTACRGGHSGDALPCTACEAGLHLDAAAGTCGHGTGAHAKATQAARMRRSRSELKREAMARSLGMGDQPGDQLDLRSSTHRTTRRAAIAQRRAGGGAFSHESRQKLLEDLGDEDGADESSTSFSFLAAVRWTLWAVVLACVSLVVCCGCLTSGHFRRKLCSKKKRRFVN